MVEYTLVHILGRCDLAFRYIILIYILITLQTTPTGREGNTIIIYWYLSNIKVTNYTCNRGILIKIQEKIKNILFIFRKID